MIAEMNNEMLRDPDRPELNGCISERVSEPPEQAKSALGQSKRKNSGLILKTDQFN